MKKKLKIKGIFDNPPAKTLFIDWEVSPHFGGFYDGYETTPVTIDKLQWSMSVAFKWLGQDKIYCYAQPDFPEWKTDKFDDSGLVRKAWEAINQADIVVAHNARKFDIKKGNTRFLMNHLGPTKPVKVIDTLQIARKYFGFPRNSLNELAKYAGIGEKLEKSHKSLLQDCLNGNQRAWHDMKSYNKHDVVLLEGLYRWMLPFVQPFPIVHSDNGKCRKCGGGSFQNRGFSYLASGGKKQQKMCLGCGSYKTDPIVIQID